jgi:hypothetical protein
MKDSLLDLTFDPNYSFAATALRTGVERFFGL